jgi:hypothetical protein
MALDTAIVRKEDELWTSYLRRRLEAAGVEPAEPQWDEEDVFSVTDFTSDRSILISNKVHDSIPEDLADIVQATNYSQLPNLIEEKVAVDILPNDDIWDIEFEFHRDGTATFKNADRVKIQGLFSDYEHQKTYSAQKVVDDIVEYVKNQDLCKAEPRKFCKLPIRIANVIESTGYLFRGTADTSLELRRENYDFYFGCFLNSNGGEYYTSATIKLIQALTYGLSRATKSQIPGSKPILLAINAQPYEDNLALGLEDPEVEIKGPIKFEDIQVISSVEQLRKLCPSAKPADIQFFQKHYLTD